MTAGQLPDKGAVLGIDVGFSTKNRSSAACVLKWDIDNIEFVIRRFRGVDHERESSISYVVGQNQLLCAAFDGPLRSGLDVIGEYRAAERLLTRKLFKRIGKPGQSSSPVGKKLNCAANSCAETVLNMATLESSSHKHRIHEKSIVEAFPSTFLGFLLHDPDAINVSRGTRSDQYYLHLAKTGVLDDLTKHLLPQRQLATPFVGITNHDDRAAVVCSLTALCVAAGQYTAVGDDDGWIILPPPNFVEQWVWPLLESNVINSEELWRSDQPA